MEWRPAGWSVSASVNLPLYHKVQKLSSGTGSPGWSRKKGRKIVVVVVVTVLLHPFNNLFSTTTWVSWHQKGKPSGFYRSKRWRGCSGISWTIYKLFAPRSRQITMPVPHHSVFTGRMPFLQPKQQRQSTEMKAKCRQAAKEIWHKAALPPHVDRSIAFARLCQSTPHLIMVRWTNLTSHPKLHLDRYSHFWTVHNTESHCKV